MSETRKLKSPKGTIRVTLTSGHVLILTEEARDVSALYWSEAYRLGAVSGDMVGDLPDSKEEIEKLKEKKVKEAFNKKLEACLKDLFENPRGAIDKNGDPLVRKVSAIIGEPVRKPEMMTLWNTLKETEG